MRLPRQWTPGNHGVPALDHGPDDLWAITTYYNPAGYRRRLSNYRTFRKYLGLPLVTVELAFGECFELGRDDAEVVVQLRDGDVMWQKERLLNVALGKLPGACEKVVALDCDLIFETADWPLRTSRLLDSLPLVQPFSHTYRTPASWCPGGGVDAGDDVLHSAGYLVQSGMSVDEVLRCFGRDIHCSHGFAWAGRRSVLEKHGFYDANVIGGGDSCLFRGAFGYFDLIVERFVLNPSRKRHYQAWAEPFFADVRGQVGHVDGAVYHLWHGSPADRRYSERHEEFAAFGFDPHADVSIGASGAWRWSSQKPDMHAYLRDYFHARGEDG